MLALDHLSKHARNQLLAARRRKHGEAEATATTTDAPASPAGKDKEPEEGAEAGAATTTPSFPPLALAGAIARMYHDDLLPLLPSQGGFRMSVGWMDEWTIQPVS